MLDYRERTKCRGEAKRRELIDRRIQFQLDNPTHVSNTTNLHKIKIIQGA